MRKLLLTAAIISGFAAQPAAAQPNILKPSLNSAQSLIINVSDGNCGWYAITVCSKGWGPANKAANKYGGHVIDTNDIDEFRDGWKCAVIPAFSKKNARKKRNIARSQGASSAYIKFGCE